MDVSISFLNRHNTKSNRFKPHIHDCFEVVYFLTGSGKTVIGDKSYPVKENCFCIIPPHTLHSEYIDGYGEIMFIGFEYKTVRFPVKEGVYAADELYTYSLFNEIFKEYREQKNGYEAAASAMLALFLIKASRLDTKSGDNERCKDLEYIKEYIRNHFDQKISFRELAALSGYSYDHFRHIFKQRFGISPQEYMIDIRLENAKKKLCETELSCTEIAYLCGFSNSAQMSSMFKKRFSVSPIEFRNTDLYKNIRNL